MTITKITTSMTMTMGNINTI